ncbi:MAG: metallophosphoesterase family protein [Capsulimonadaceae bacterium]
MIYAIGDIHGSVATLEPALEHLKRVASPEDAVVFLGDYIDRGPDSEGVLRRLLNFREHHEWTVFLRGNHEDMLLRALQGDKRREEMWLFNGGMYTLASFGLEGDSNWKRRFPRWAFDFLKNTEIEVRSRNFCFVHAGIVPVEVESEVESDLDARMWVRDPFINYPHNLGSIVVFGHTPTRDRRPVVHANKVGIDTGACQPGGRLSVACFDDERPGRTMPEFVLFQVRDDGTETREETIRTFLTRKPVHQPPSKFSVPRRTRVLAG